MVLGEVFLDMVLKKSGPELFKELYRQYPLSEVEDYFGNGFWNDALMRSHYKLFFQHREEAGSPDPPPLSEIKFPDLPTGNSMGITAALKLAVSVQGGPAVPKFGGGNTQMAQLMAAALKLAQGGPKAAGIVPKLTVGAQTGVSAAPKAFGGPANAQAVVELKSIMGFVAKHKLDFAKTSNMIMSVPLMVRQAVMQQFAPKEGSDPVQELKTFIEEKKATAPALSVGIKRPAVMMALPAGPAAAAQRPRLMMPVGARPMVPGLVTK